MSCTAQFELSIVKNVESAAMPDADNDAVGQFTAKDVVERVLEAFVDSGCRLVEKCGSRSDQEDSGERQPLLFARRQNSSPISRLVEPTDQMCEMHLGERVVEPAVVEVRAPGVRLT